MAVKPCRNVRPPTGPISPAQNMPATGAPPSAAAVAAASWSGAPEEARAAAVAGEEQAAAHPPGQWRAVLERRTEPGVGGRRVAHVEPERLPHPRHVADRDRARLGVAAQDAADEVVVGAVVDPVLVDDQPREDAPLRQLDLLPDRALPTISTSRSYAGRPASSWITFDSARVTTISGPIGAHPCETSTRSSTGPSRSTITAPSRCT